MSRGDGGNNQLRANKSKRLQIDRARSVIKHTIYILTISDLIALCVNAFACICARGMSDL